LRVVLVVGVTVISIAGAITSLIIATFIAGMVTLFAVLAVVIVVAIIAVTALSISIFIFRRLVVIPLGVFKFPTRTTSPSTPF
jgi:hypothetical protein